MLGAMPRIGPNVVLLTLVGVALLIGVVAVLALRREIAAWRLARREGIPLEFGVFLGMRLRGANGLQLVRAVLRARDAGLAVAIDFLEVHYLAGGDADAIVDAAIALHGKGRPVEWDALRACDLAERDVRAIVAAGVDPAMVVGSQEYWDRFGKGTPV